MAQLFPSILDPKTKSSAERRLYEAFARELDDAWVIFHHVKWIGKDDLDRPRDGETDFVVAHPHLGVLVIEVKGGRIRFDENTGHYISTDRDDKEHDIGDPFEDATEQKHILIQKLRSIPNWPRRRVVFGQMVAFPDAVIEGDLRLNAPREIIIDAVDLIKLEERLRGALAYWQGENPIDSPPRQAGIDVLIELLAQSRHIRNPLLAEQVRADQEAIVRLTEQQFRYLRFLSGQRRVAIAGCAGSGKTFLALEKARRLAGEGLNVLFTCYNRALADHLGDTLGYRKHFHVFSFHQLCVHWAQEVGERLSYRENAPPEYFDVILPNALFNAVEEIGASYDAIIIDEGQDFRPEWWEVIPWLLRNPYDDILYVFYDDNQRVYRDRSAIPIEAAPFILDENCRNTQRIFDVVGQFYQGEELPHILGPEGHPSEIIQYEGEREGLDQLRKLLHRLLNENGFTLDEIAILTARGTGSSNVLGQRLGNVELADRLPLQPGEVLATTIRRFKGLERPVIVLCEVDATLSAEDVEALMYVGTSRAKTYLVILVDKNAPEGVRTALDLPIARS
jgi:superfamily I DNA/RNA helicase